MDVKKTSVAGTMESSDIMVTLEPGAGSIEIDLESIVEKQFGREIRRAISETLESLQIRSAKVKAVDKGALDCTIRARVKTAAARSNEKIVFDWKV
jgi:citrate lyase subunit gamma (acyl carrier protein)